MEPRRIALAVVLMAAVILLTNVLFPTPKTPVTNSVVAADSLVRADSAATRRDSATSPASGVPNTTASAGAAPLGAGPAGATAGRDTGALAAPVDTAAVKTAHAVYRTTNRGAGLIGAELGLYPTLKNHGRVKEGVVELASPNDPLISFRLVLPGDTVRLDKQMFRTTRSEANGQSVVRYDAMIAARAVSITYSFLPDSYRVNIAAKVDGAPANSFLLVDMPPGFHSSEADTVEDASHLSYAYKPETQNAKGVTFHSLDPGERKIASGPITWVVAKNKYFLVGLLTPVGKPPFIFPPLWLYRLIDGQTARRL